MCRALIIGGSPRRKGNSDLMALWAKEYLDTQSISNELFFLRDYKFSPCIACGGCDKTGKCVLKDEMNLFYPKLEAAEKIIISAPIYFQSLGALTKGFIDRLQPYWTSKFVQGKSISSQEKKFFLSLFCGGTDFKDTFTCSEKIIKIAALHLDAKYFGSCNFAKIDAKGDIQKDTGNRRHIEETLANLFELGK